ncbi:MAG: hypothetical protein QOE27_942, partial [Solirubrobacteraceae bacterium]|nr:hypothetical protein [Solirubrobacteraceae bacterium]
RRRPARGLGRSSGRPGGWWRRLGRGGFPGGRWRRRVGGDLGRGRRRRGRWGRRAPRDPRRGRARARRCFGPADRSAPPGLRARPGKVPLERPLGTVVPGGDPGAVRAGRKMVVEPIEILGRDPALAPLAEEPWNRVTPSPGEAASKPPSVPLEPPEGRSPGRPAHHGGRLRGGGRPGARGPAEVSEHLWGQSTRGVGAAHVGQVLADRSLVGRDRIDPVGLAHLASRGLGHLACTGLTRLGHEARFGSAPGPAPGTVGFSAGWSCDGLTPCRFLSAAACRCHG